MVNGLLRGTAAPAAQFWAPGSPGYRATPQNMTYGYDTDRARALLTDAGFPNGIDVSDDPDVLWNFEKFLIARDGTVVRRFAPTVAPDDPMITAAIEEQLAR